MICIPFTNYDLKTKNFKNQNPNFFFKGCWFLEKGKIETMNETNTYLSQETWRRIMALMPDNSQIENDDLPKEEFWQWNENQIHLDRYENPSSKYKIILHHGVGTNGRQMMLLVGARLAKRGYAVIAPDNLGYGMTKVNQKEITFDDWIKMLSDLIDFEMKRDGKPVVLYGLSAGGMLTYHAAALNKKVKGIIGMTFLDERIFTVRRETVLFPLMAYSVPLVVLLGKIPFLKKLKIPIKWVSKMYTLTNHKDALKVFLRDKSSSASLVSLQFLSSLMTYKPALEPKEFTICPILLTQPEEDSWTREHLSLLSLADVKAPLTIKRLKNAGHFPMEQPGIDQLEEYIVDFIENKI